MKKNVLNIDADLIIDSLNLMLIAVFLCGYTVFSRHFAELHFKTSLLDFPVFIGEVLLSILLLLTTVKLVQKKNAPNKFYTFSFIYFLVIIIIAVVDYFFRGPISFRNAALFYYPIFALFAYDVFNYGKCIVKYKLFIFSFVGLILIGLFFKIFSSYYVLSYWSVALVLSLVLEGKWRWVMIFLLGVQLFSDAFFIVGSRSHMIGTLLWLCTIAMGLWFNLGKKIIWLKWISLIIFFIALSSLIFVFKDKTAIKSIVAFDEIRQLYKESKDEIAKKKDYFQFKELEPNIYNPNNDKIRVFNDNKTVVLNSAHQKQGSVYDEPDTFVSEYPAIKEIISVKNELDGLSEENDKTQVGNTFDNNIKQNAINKSNSALDEVRSLEQARKRNIAGSRSYSTALVNIVFRVLIWEDMFVELIQERAWLGVGFGKAQRSKSIEILDWAEREWKRDGWITAHNSFLNVIYRLGFLGLALIFYFFYWIFKLTRTFFLYQNFKGVVMVAVLFYWIALSNFLVILELPYFAIPFWIFFGFTTAYYQSVKQSHETCISKS